MERPPLSEIIAFNVVAEHRSFRRAADALGLAASTLSHTIASLESRLGVRLLHRTTRSVALTEAGEEFRGRVQPLLRELDLALEAARQFGQTVGGTVRISAAAPAIVPLLDRVLPALRQRHPQVHIEFAADGRFVDIIEDGFDAGIRFGDATPKDMIGVPFGRPSRFVAIAAPAYLDRRGRPAGPDDLAGHDAIRMRLTSGRILDWTFSKDGAHRSLTPSGPITLSDVALQVAAAAKGLGIAYVWEEAALPRIRNGSLEIVLGDWAPPATRLLLYYPGRRRIPPALRALVEAIRADDRRARPSVGAADD